jgi:hypothetical protein
MHTDADTVFLLWCRLTGTAPADFIDEEREGFLVRPQVARLATVPYPVLLEAGVDAARLGTLPLERWLDAVHAIRTGV